MSDQLQAARDKAVEAVAAWLTVYGDEVGAEADRKHQETGSPVDALRFVLEKGQEAVLDARSIVSEGFQRASEVQDRLYRDEQPPALTEEELDAQVAALASDPDTWVIDTPLEDAVKEASEWVERHPSTTEDEGPEPTFPTHE